MDSGEPTRDQARQLRQFLGDSRFRRFVGQIRHVASEGGSLYPWHIKVLDAFELDRGCSVSRVPLMLAKMLANEIPAPPVLGATSVPSWLQVDELDGACPVQGYGALLTGRMDRRTGAPETWGWYFRARGEHWSITAVADGLDLFSIPTDSDQGFYYEEQYEAQVGVYDAGYMSIDTARYYIVRELGRLRMQLL